MGAGVSVSRRAALMAGGACLAAAIAGCSTDSFDPVEENPPPAEPFNHFGQFQLKPVALYPDEAQHDYSQSAATAINNDLQPTLGILLDSWDKGSGRTLQVAPFVERISFDAEPNGFLAGTSAGRALVVMRVTFTDEATGALVANPVFFQHGFGWGTSATVDESDSATLAGIVDLITEYTRDNYQEAIGGPSGALPGRRRG